MKLFSLGLAAVATLALTAATSSAAVIGAVNDTFTIKFKGTDVNVTDSSGFNAWLTSELTYTVTGRTDTSLFLDVLVKNTTQSPYTSVITAFGFNVDPNMTSANIVSGPFTVATLNTAVNAHGLPAYIGANAELCVNNNANSCSGGNPNTGVGTNSQAIQKLELVFGSLPATVTLDKFWVRYQSLTFNNVTFGSGSGAGIPCTQDDEVCGTNGGGDVPEPATMALVGLGLIGAGALRRRK